MIIGMTMTPIGPDLNAWSLVVALFRKDWEGRGMSVDMLLGFKKQI